MAEGTNEFSPQGSRIRRRVSALEYGEGIPRQRIVSLSTTAKAGDFFLTDLSRAVRIDYCLTGTGTVVFSASAGQQNETRTHALNGTSAGMLIITPGKTGRVSISVQISAGSGVAAMYLIRTED